ncbi:cellulase family glycosylhydrolase [Actinomycetes bacterium KLBMP 9759]
MPLRHARTGLRKKLIAAVGCAAGMAGLLTFVAPVATASAADTSRTRGVNWADPRDNYAPDELQLSGLSTKDGYHATYAKATVVISEFASVLGANTVRLPVNPATVNGRYWESYAGVIDAALAKGFTVILCYWESSTTKDGRIDDKAAFDRMWSRVTSKYAGADAVTFEPMNEPFGYSGTEWPDIAAQWVQAHPEIPRHRILVGGIGYSEDVKPVCADRRLAGTRLALHFYGFWNKERTDPKEWAKDMKARIGDCASRTILDEFGAAMTTGLDYDGPVNGSYEVAYIQAVTDTLRELRMGSVYWPGLRTHDSYSMTTLQGGGSERLRLTVNNPSGARRLTWGWGQDPR